MKQLHSSVCFSNETISFPQHFFAYLFEGEVAGPERFLDFSITTLLRRMNGGSKSVQNAFKSKLFHVGPSDFPEFFFLFRFNGGDF